MHTQLAGRGSGFCRSRQVLYAVGSDRLHVLEVSGGKEAIVPDSGWRVDALAGGRDGVFMLVRGEVRQIGRNGRVQLAFSVPHTANAVAVLSDGPSSCRAWKAAI